MSYKDQTKCYRTIDGIQWPNLCDVLELYHEEEVEKRKLAGQRIKLRKHRDGYFQAFIHPEDLNKKF